MGNKDVIKELHIYQHEIPLIDKEIGAEAQNIDVSYDVNGEIIEDIKTSTPVVTIKPLSKTLKEMEAEIGDISDAVTWNEMNKLGAKNLIPIGKTTTYNGITFTVNTDGSVTISGVATVGTTAEYVVDFEDVIDEKCLFTIADESVEGNLNSSLIIKLENNGSPASTISPYFDGDEASSHKTINEELVINENSHVKHFKIIVKSGGNFSTPFIVKPMLRFETIENRDYEPFAKTNLQLTKETVDMVGASSSANGKHGFVPAPTIAEKDKFLKGDGTWEEIDDMVGATASTAGKHGLVPAPTSADVEKFLGGNGQWNEIRTATKLKDLDDVFISNNITTDDKLVFEGNKWVNQNEIDFLKNNGNWISNEYDLEYLPFNILNNQLTVVYNDELYAYGDMLYKWNGIQWSEIHNSILGDTNIRLIVCNNKLYAMNRLYLYEWKSTNNWSIVSSIPNAVMYGFAITYNNEIHLLDDVKHIKWSGNNWVTLEDIPYPFYGLSGSAVVYNNKIYLLGSPTSGLKISTWDGTQWEQLSQQLPYVMEYSSAVVYNNEIHILGGSGHLKAHRSWDGVSSSWASPSTLPYDFYKGSAVVYNNEIHILGGIYNNFEHRKYSSSWSKTINITITFPYKFYNGSIVIYNNKIHILGGAESKRRHLEWDGVQWNELPQLPYDFYNGAAVVYNDEIHILGGESEKTEHRKWNGIQWSNASTLPYNFYNGSAVVYNNEIHILGGGTGNTEHRKWDGTSWFVVSTLPYNFYSGSAIVYNNKIHILSGKVTDTEYYHYEWNENSSWIKLSDISQDTSSVYGVESATIYNKQICIIRGMVSFIWNASNDEWIPLNNMNYSHSNGSIITYNGQLYIYGGDDYLTEINSYKEEYFKLNGLANNYQPGLIPAIMSSTNAQDYFLHADNTWTQIGIKKAETGIITSESTAGIDYQLSLDESAILFVTTRQTGNDKAWRGTHAYYFNTNRNAAWVSGLYRTLLGSSGSASITITNATNSLTFNLKASNGYTARYLLLRLNLPYS